MSRSLSAEMMQYVSEGTCPRCGVAILSPDYARQHRQAMQDRVLDFKLSISLAFGQSRQNPDQPINDPLVPAGAKAVCTGIVGMKCLTCMKTWPFFPPKEISTETPQVLWPSPSLKLPAVPDPPPPARPARPNTPRTLRPPTADQPPAARSTDLTTQWRRRYGPAINLENYRLVAVKEGQPTSTVLRKETKTYPNGSSGRITPKVAITDSVTKVVTFETNKIKAFGGQTGVTILGFASIQGQIQQQLGQKHAVEVQRTLSVSEEVQIEVPPHSAIELSITWKMEWFNGTAVLGSTPGTDSVEVPYSIQHRLSFDWRTRDVPLTE